ncbi:hypothetical protein HXX76_015524 [Chlamydomonas incerta]|uniref:Uncharacterized protein n=1 Tax=Chlamydomonas incerta TaxID=51695 RepID=A0A835SIR3_CHLIN|nr:hypothetical protein HXX76_015524 [Chlamydomonas incerta]|eukprot:KAG2423139.1 hypothetical protein HXX76_015524 [Chlamydomonas incerta]
MLAQKSGVVSKQQARCLLATPAVSARSAARTFKPCASASAAAAVRVARPQHSGRRGQCIQTEAVARPSVYFFGFGGDDEDYDENYTVMKVQVGMFGDVKKWQKDLERLSEQFDTEDEEGLHYILQDTVTKLLRNMEYISYAATAGKVYDNLDECEQKFNQVSLEERSKFKEETFSNVDGRRRTRALDVSSSPDVGLDTWLCCTLLVAVEGKFKLPKVSSAADLKKALTLLGSASPDTLLAFELLWTPQADGDSYSKDELLGDFPTLALL